MRKRMVSLLGPPGMGKTRLALELASGLRPRFPDGVWLIELAPLDKGEILPSAVAEAVGLVDEGKSDILAQVWEGLRNARALLLLDNCEHLLEAVAEFCDNLLRRCGQLTVLATSRERLGVPGEFVWRIPPMDLPAQGSGYSPMNLASVESVALFLERALQVQPDMTVDQLNVAATRELTVQLEGIPLAIELAAAWCGVLTPAELLAHVGDRLNFLTARDRTTSRRHMSLRAAIDASHSLLDAPHASLFQRLGLFAGGWTVDSMTSVCSLAPAESVPMLARLVDRSLVNVVEGEDRAATRYRMLESLREYAVEKLGEAGDLETTGRTFAAYFLEMAESAAEGIYGSIGSEWLSVLDIEHDNCRAAIERMLEVDPSVALRIAAALGPYWAIRGHYHEGLVRLRGAVEANDGEASVALATALRHLAYISYEQGSQTDAKRFATLALRVSEQVADEVSVVLALQQLAQIGFGSGDLHESRLRAEEAMEKARELDRPGLLGLCTFRLGIVAMAEQRWQSAEELFTKTARLATASDDVEQHSAALSFLARVYLRLGQTEAAKTVLRQSLAEMGDRGTPRQIALLIQSLAAVAVARGEVPQGVRLAAAAKRLREAVGVRARSPLQADLDAELNAVLEDAAYGRAAAEGYAMTEEMAIRAALEEQPQDVSRAGRGRPSRPGGLTDREWRVAQLAAEGLMNRDIAGRLFLSERTVEAHLEHIRNKLAVHTRAQIAAWVAESGPDQE